VISVDIAGFRFQLRAAAVIIHAQSVLLHRLEGDTYWALPGGRVEPGEDARATLIREMQEELDEAVEVDDLLYVVENFFSYADKPNHEVGMYFKARFRPQSPLLNQTRTHWGVEGTRRLEFQWFACDQLPQVDLRPTFLQQALNKPVLQFAHVVQRDSGSVA
jgi:ADP-ribose pyrophosphatase YjhB (NUDIX family)